MFRKVLSCLSICIVALAVSDGIEAATQTMSDTQANRPRLGLVLSGGGARGFAHIGALKAFEELGVPFDVVAATSMGAMVGGAYAAGLSAGQIRDITLGVDWGRMFAPRPDRKKLSWREKADDRAGYSAVELGLGPAGFKLPSEVVPSQELDMFLSRANQPFNSINDLTELSIPFAAMATDLESGERVVLSHDITLTLAMRASMSIPGAFAPVEYRGRMLVDGGLVDNLPVAQAREMGADVVIAINVGTPLSKRDKLNNVVGIMGQMVNLLTEQNVQHSKSLLTDKDVYLQPELGELTSGDFRRAAEIMELGYRAVMDNKEKFTAFAVSRTQYRQWAQARASLSKAENIHTVAEVRVEGLKTVNPERVLSEIDIDTTHPVTNDQVEEAARDVWAMGDFQSVPFHFEPGPRGTEVLVFKPTEKEWGYSSFRIGGNVQTDFRSSNTFNVLLGHTWGWLNSWGAQWRNEIQIGEIKRAASEWYQPLGPTSNWFVMPSISYQWEPFDVYLGSRDEPIARYRNEQLDISLALGYEIARIGRVEANVGWLDNRSAMEIGIFDQGARAQALYGGIGIEIDTLDNPSFPKSGVLFNSQVYRTVDPSQEHMDEIEGTLYSISASVPVPLGKNTTLLLSAKAGKASQVGNFNLGGVFNLSGSAYGRYSGSRMHLARAMVYHDVSRVMREMRMPVYVGATYETGRVWDEADYAQQWGRGKHWMQAASVFVATDSWIGPIYLVAGRTFGEGSAITLYWGRLQ